MNSIASNLSSFFQLDWIWQDELWLPRGLKFEELQPEHEGFAFSQKGELIIFPIVAVFVCVLRFIFSKCIAIPLANFFNLSEKEHKVEHNRVLEQFYSSVSRNPDNKSILVLAKKLDWTNIRINRWFRRRRNKDRLSKKTKFVETLWRFSFYVFASSFGTFTISKAPFIWGNEKFWTEMPASFWPEVYYYYVIEGSFYLSLLFSITTDVKRKDFTAQFIHHIATLVLISFSYCGNFTRIGIIVMLLHDLSDIFLELAKCLSYIKYHVTTEILFSVFAITFIVTRVIIFPFYIIRLTLFNFLPLDEWIFAVVFFNVFLLILQVLHLFWTSIILKMIWRQLFTERIKTDDRSDQEELSTDE